MDHEKKIDADEIAQEVASAVLGALDPKLVAVAGVGAWSFGFYRYGWTPVGDRQKAGLLAVKKALIANGFGSGVLTGALAFGGAARDRTKDFQQAEQIAVDGVVGPHTARLLWRRYAATAEGQRGIPNHWLGRIATGESNNDPVAEGVADPDDEGIVQINLPFHPEVSLAQAWDPSYSLTWAANRLASDFRSTGTWKGAVAAHNIGTTYARQWVEAGCPDSGGPQMGTDNAGDPIFAFERATNYVAYVGDLPF